MDTLHSLWKIWKNFFLYKIKCYQQLYLSKSSIFPPFLFICLKKSKQIKFQIQRKQFYISICNSKHWPCSWGYYVYFSLKFEQNNEQLDEMRAKLAAKIVNSIVKTWMFDIDCGYTFILKLPFIFVVYPNTLKRKIESGKIIK